MKLKDVVSDASVLYPAGTCSSAQTEAISQLQPETSVSCHLSFTSDAIDFPANDVFKAHTGFDSSIGKDDLSSDHRLYVKEAAYAGCDSVESYQFI